MVLTLLPIGDHRGAGGFELGNSVPNRLCIKGLKALVRGLKDEAEMEAIADALEKTNWCRKDAAQMLGISYKALLYKMRQFNLDSGRGARSAAAKAAAAAKGASAKEAAKETANEHAPAAPAIRGS